MYCKKCGQMMAVHAHGKRTPKKEEVVYASCLNKEMCTGYQDEVAFTNGVLH